MAPSKVYMDNWPSLATEAMRLREENKELRSALSDLLTNEPCSLDHHGFCQTHYCHPPCPHERAKKLLGKS